MSLPLSELGLPTPLPRNRWGTHAPACEGVGESQFGRLEHSAYSVSLPHPREESFILKFCSGQFSSLSTSLCPSPPQSGKHQLLLHQLENPF